MRKVRIEHVGTYILCYALIPLTSRSYIFVSREALLGYFTAPSPFCFAFAVLMLMVLEKMVVVVNEQELLPSVRRVEHPVRDGILFIPAMFGCN